MTSENILDVNNLVVRRGKAIILNIPEFYIQAERSLALIGPNGTGKSTLLLTLAGLLPFSSGQLFFEGNPVCDRASLSHLRRNAAVVFQEPLLLNETVHQNVALGLKFRHVNSHEIKKRVEEALDYFGVTHLAVRSAKTLSGGEAKRVSLARAFALKPRLILLDEAFTSLDPPSKEAIIDDLRHILDETKITAILALHDREETLRLAQNVAVMQNGRIVQFGATAQVFNRPNDEFVANFVGTESILEGLVQNSAGGLMGIVVGGKLIEAAGSFPSGQKVYCCLRPEHITISLACPGKTSARNIFEAKIKKIIRQAFFYKVLLDCGFPLVAYITVPSCDDLGICEEATVTASFKATSVHVIRRE